jgi:4a-hydroxytetrahydrobiopterin dehydratase
LAGRPRAADNGEMVPRLSDAEVEAALARLPGWEREGDMIVKRYELASFPGAIAFVGRVADAAEAADHHPDLDIRYRTVRVALTTHDAGGLSRRDLDLAAQIEGLVE